MPDATGTITLRLHGVLQDVVGAPTLAVSTDDRSITPNAVFELAVLRHPGLAAYRDTVAFGSDREVIPADRALPPVVRIVEVLPPVSGG